MQTNFSSEALSDPAQAASEAIIRKCVHCGFCTATCPTYVLLGDELDSPRGRIYLIKDMLENEKTPTAKVVKHIDRCLSCLSCMTTCPSGVNYMHLVDHARTYIERSYRRPWHERFLRSLLAAVLPYPRRFRAALALARLVRPFGPLLARSAMTRPAAAMLALAPGRISSRSKAHSGNSAGTRGRIALLQGCAEPVLRPEIRAATVRVLERAGYETVFASGEVCCGALTHHMGKERPTLAAIHRNVDAWTRLIEEGGLTAIAVTTSGCGTMIKDYGFILRDDPDYADRARQVSEMTKDISELLLDADLSEGDGRGLVVAYHAACSLQHGQRVSEAPRRVLTASGYAVRTPVEAHLCCGSAGTYNIFQPVIAGQLGDRKAANLDRLGTDVIATGNIGCSLQIGGRSITPVVHLIELVDWATGGPCPAELAHLATERIGS